MVIHSIEAERTKTEYSFESRDGIQTSEPWQIHVTSTIYKDIVIAVIQYNQTLSPHALKSLSWQSEVSKCFAIRSVL